MNDVTVHDAEFQPIDKHEEVLRRIREENIPIEKLFAAVVHRVRAKLQNHTHITTMCLSATATGRVHNGDIDISFSFNDYPVSAESGSLTVALDEFIRQKTFRHMNRPLSLGYDGGVG
jgi:hypothetical protein